MSWIGTIFGFVAGSWTRLLIYGLVAVMALGTAAGLGYHRGVRQLWDYQVKQATQAVKIIVKQGAVTEKIITEYIYIEGKTRTITNVIEKEVIRYVEAGLDRCPLSRGAVVLHDAAAANIVPDPTRTIDGTTSGLEVAALTKTCTENYAEYHRTAARLSSLQKWVKKQAEVEP